jgi:hypothetical protein
MLSQPNSELLCRSGPGTPRDLEEATLCTLPDGAQDVHVREGELPFFSFDWRAIDAFAPPPDLAATAA